MINPPSPVVRGGFFDFLDERDRADLEPLGGLQQYARGALLMRQGDAAESICIILEGRAKIVLDTSDGRSIVLTIFGPGDVLGEFEAFGGYPTIAATVIALDAVVARVMTRADFVDYLMTHPAASIGLVRMMIGRLGAADRRRISGTLKDAPFALARLLVELADGAGSPQERTIDLDVPLAQDEIASLIGVSRNSVVRALATLRSLGLITTTRGTIRILDADALRRYADASRG